MSATLTAATRAINLRRSSEPAQPQASSSSSSGGGPVEAHLGQPVGGTKTAYDVRLASTSSRNRSREHAAEAPEMTTWSRRSGAERRRNRTYPPAGYAGGPVLKLPRASSAKRTRGLDRRLGNGPGNESSGGLD